ncbi:MAG: hypothetical protein JSU08_05925 [Acidobacteria bacterium]|nr:hypothetical protein [Acidobacteriota bacterium]
MRALGPLRLPHPPARLCALAALALLMHGCANSPAAPSSASTSTANGSANLQFCADEINKYRASVGRAPLTRSSALESFAGEAVQHDHTAGVPHLFFRNTNGGGVAMAETELLRWKNYAVRDVIKEGLAGMWAAGPNGEHYGILTGPYTEVGCGVFVDGSTVSVAQDFR